MNATRRRLLEALMVGTGIGAFQRALANGELPLQAGLQRLIGTVTVNGSPARVGQDIRPGDVVHTGTGAEAIYVIGQDAFLQRENSEIRFGAEAMADFMRVVSGKILSVFGRSAKRLAVGTATIGIRGTACYIEEREHATYFCLCYGEAEVVPRVAPHEREVIRTSHHDHPILIHADPRMSTSMAPTDVVNHSDAELTLLESLVGRRPPFYGKYDVSY